MADYENTCEIAIEWVKGQNRATITAYSNSRVKGKLMKLAESNPDDVDVFVNKDGSVVGHVPVSYVKISPPRKVSDEQKELARERFALMREQGLL